MPIPVVVSFKGQEQVKMPTEQEDRINEPFLDDWFSCNIVL